MLTRDSPADTIAVSLSRALGKFDIPTQGIEVNAGANANANANISNSEEMVGMMLT